MTVMVCGSTPRALSIIAPKRLFTQAPTTTIQPVHKKMTGDAVRWSVLWVKKSGVVLETLFEQDLPGAIALYTRAQAAGKSYATLRSMNCGFPPPEKYQPYMKTVVVRVKGRKVKRLKKVTPMLAVNNKGFTWCPYCLKLRRFQRQGAVMYENVRIPADGDYCPLCGTSERDFHVRAHNPVYAKKYISR